MASNFSSLRNARTAAINKLNEEIKKESAKGGGNDERFWRLTVDAKTKVGYAVIRFLPAPKGEELPWARRFSHNFKLNGAWYIENCPSTLGVQGACPVCKDNNRLWNSGNDKDKDVARDHKRQLRFISNILVVNDSAHPENNGKVMLFQYGPKIHEKIQEQINPQFPDQQPTNPFDLWEGANFKLKSMSQGGFQNYDKSEFDTAAPVPGSDDELEKLWESEYPLLPFTAADQFKAYDALEKRLQTVLHGAPAKTAEDAIKAQQPTTADAATLAEAVKDDKPKRRNRQAPAEVKEAANTNKPADDEAVPESEEDIRAFFSNVLND
jgi:hypothetical protein